MKLNSADRSQRGFYPLDNVSGGNPRERERPLRPFVSRLYYKGQVLIEVEVLSDTQSNATAQAQQDHRDEAEQLLPDYESDLFCGYAKWLSDPLDGRG